MCPSFHTNPRGSWVTAGAKVRLPPRFSQLQSHVCSQGLALTGRQTPDVSGTAAHATCAGGPAASPVRHLVLYNDFHPIIFGRLRRRATSLPASLLRPFPRLLVSAHVPNLSANAPAAWGKATASRQAARVHHFHHFILATVPDTCSGRNAKPGATDDRDE